MGKVAIGQQFGSLTVVSRAGTAKDKHILWNCQCACGNETVVASNHLVRPIKATTSCGCVAIKHGESRSRGYTLMYRVWLSMRERCNNPKTKNYHNYGGRGITVCPEWDSYEQFKIDMGSCPPNMSLDRIDNNGSYSKDNCRWATAQEQVDNSRRVRRVTVEDETRTVAGWSRELGVHPASFYHYAGARGISLEEAITYYRGRS